MKPLPLKEREYRLSLQRTERRAIIPIKWFILVGTAVLYFWLIRPQSPAAAEHVSDRPVVVLLSLYAAFNIFQSYMFYIRGVRLNAVKPLTLISYLVDVVFIAMLIYFDTATYYFGRAAHPNTRNRNRHSAKHSRAASRVRSRRSIPRSPAAGSFPGNSN